MRTPAFVLVEPTSLSYEEVGVWPVLLFLRLSLDVPLVGVFGGLSPAFALPSFVFFPPRSRMDVLLNVVFSAVIPGTCNLSVRPVLLKLNAPGLPVIGFSSS